MERSARATLAGRGLAAGLLAGVLALAWLQGRSHFARSLDEGRPLLGWLALQDSEDAPAVFLCVYRPARRTLDIVYIPPGTPIEGRRTLETIYKTALKHGASPQETTQLMTQNAATYLAAKVAAWKDWSDLPVWLGRCPGFSSEPPLDAMHWLLLLPKNIFARGQAATLWIGSAGSWPFWDRLLLAFDLSRLRPDGLRPAWLAPEEQSAAHLSHILYPGGDESAAVTVEVLNATEQPGIASRVKNILRLKGADVMSVGNSPAGDARTVVYDRTGRFAAAAAVRAMLGCPAASALTRVDLKRMVDVTVVAAGDCPWP